MHIVHKNPARGQTTGWGEGAGTLAIWTYSPPNPTPCHSAPPLSPPLSPFSLPDYTYNPLLCAVLTSTDEEEIVRENKIAIKERKKTMQRGAGETDKGLCFLVKVKDQQDMH